MALAEEIRNELLKFNDNRYLTNGASLNSYALARELEEAWKYAYRNYYKHFTYTSGDLTAIDIYTTSAMSTKLFNKTLTYTSGDLTQVKTTRISDGATLTKTLAYSGGDLHTIAAAVA